MVGKDGLRCVFGTAAAVSRSTSANYGAESWPTAIPFPLLLFSRAAGSGHVAIAVKLAYIGRAAALAVATVLVLVRVVIVLPIFTVFFSWASGPCT